MLRITIEITETESGIVTREEGKGFDPITRRELELGNDLKELVNEFLEEELPDNVVEKVEWDIKTD